MRIPPEALIDGCVDTLQRHVLPSLTTRFARGQLYTVLDVLRNLRDRIEPRAALFQAEAESAAAALTRATATLRTGSHEAVAEAETIDALLAAAPAAPPAARRHALNEALVTALERIDALSDGQADAARASLGGHLAAQAIRDLAALKPSLLEEISRG